VTLAIETSCDDTCVTVLHKTGDAARVLFNAKVTSDNRKFGGIHPDEAVQGHSSSLAGIVQAAIQKLPAGRPKPDFISVTRGPGIASALSIGLTMAKGLAVAWDRPLVAVHHMQAHALTPRLVEALANDQQQQQPQQPPQDSVLPPPPQGGARPAFPFLSLLVSGGHTQLLLTRSAVSHTTLAEATNVAIGDMLDKCARAILPRHILAETPDVMYAAELERFAFAPTPHATQPSPSAPPPPNTDYTYTPPLTRNAEIQPYTSPHHAWTLTPPFHARRDMAFDFSGLGGQVQAIMQRNPTMDHPQRAELARETMRLAFEHLASRVLFALDGMRSAARAAGKEGTEAATLPVKTLVVSGGVASNRFLMHVLRRVLAARGYGGPEGLAVVRPPQALCTDNAVMVAWAGMEMWEAGWYSDLSVLPQRRWGMDDGCGDGGQETEIHAGGQQGSERKGILGLDGWRRRFPDAEVLSREAAEEVSETEEKDVQKGYELRGKGDKRRDARL
jgi:tRNA A37 threonylcarbamoyltransferase TsaD